MTEPDQQPAWNEELSRQFIDYGRYFVPEREHQIDIMTKLLPDHEESWTVLELCCGEGLLAEALLERYPACRVVGLDGSAEMLRRAGQRLARFGARFQPGVFDLAAAAWRQVNGAVQAVVSSLAIHHLDAAQKQQLFRDIHILLSPGAPFVIADMIEPAHARGRQVAATAWDEVVRERAMLIDGSTQAFDFFAGEHWNTYRYPDPDDIDRPSPLFDQLKWLAQAGFVDVDVHWMRAGHALFSGWKRAAAHGAGRLDPREKA